MMAGSTPIPLVVPIPIQLGDPIFSAICAWPFPDAFVSRLLRDDIPQRIKFGRARMWAYLGPARDIVGFGSIDVCTDYGALTRNKPHPHIPLLAVNPENQGSGYGKSIVRHLIDEASLLACQPGNLCHDFLFLEVYASSLKAIGLYENVDSRS